MARGWESKSVEEQQENALQTPSGNAYGTEEERKLAAVTRAERERQLQSLNLQRELILSQKTSNSGRRSALEAALTQIESQIAALN